MEQERSELPKVAVIVTEYRFNSHAEVIVGRLLGHFDHKPQIEVVSLYVDQFPDNDQIREEARLHGIPIMNTIEAAIHEAHRHTLSGVLIIGEHGDYPRNEKGQKCYPRRQFLEETIKALDALDCRVPIFLDKHLSWNMEDALWMYEALQQRHIPFLGGSSIPHVETRPSVDRSSLRNPKYMLALSFGGTEDYGYHALEVLQSFAELRDGGEKGVSSVYASSGAQVWEKLEQTRWLEPLLEQALNTYPDRKEGHPRVRVADPVLFEIDYVDGLKGYVLQLPDEVVQWSLAWENADGSLWATRFDSGLERPFHHFETLTTMIETMIRAGHSPVPMERGLLTTGMIHYAMESLFRGERQETPALLIPYCNPSV